jgi:hypothetical protein
LCAGTYIGCFQEPYAHDTDGTYYRALNFITATGDMTVELCMMYAEQMGYQFAAVQYIWYCFGGVSSDNMLNPVLCQ